jgi:16S rRNA (guanine(527)-N(7))-methyltransferase RsmG
MFHVERTIEKFFPNKDLIVVMDRMRLLKELYFKWNEAINISSIRDEDGFWLKHVADSLCLSKYLHDNYNNESVLDVGSGGGFPALIIAIMLESQVTALEPIKKKTDFIDHCSLKLGLTNLKTINAKFENLNKSYPVVVSRALGLYNSLCAHFFEEDTSTKIIIMTTNKNITDLKYEYKISTTEYDFVNAECSDKLKDHILCECFCKKS